VSVRLARIAGRPSPTRVSDEEGIFSVEKDALHLALGDVMPTARLCRVDNFAKLPAYIPMVGDAA
jgi:hypothetical protein